MKGGRAPARADRSALRAALAALGRVRSAALGAGWLALLTALPAGADRATEDDEYVFRLAGCTACHTREDGAHLAGGPGLETPFGTFYAPNITSDPEHGIGRWSERDLVRALHEGVSPDGAHYYPVFPYTSYTRMSSADAGAIYRHLMAVPAVDEPRREHDVPWYLGFRILNWLWKLLFFDREPLAARTDRSAAWNRGEYIARALAHCGECHSPRNLFGAVDASRHLGGNPSGPGGGAVPNITPDEEGIGSWNRGEIAYYLTTGAMPDGDYAGGAMAEVIDAGLQHLRPEDAEALAEYLLAVPPIPGPRAAR